jgi:flagellar protein FlgJ
MNVSPPTRHAIGRVATPDANATPEEKLRGTAQSLQGVFVEQLFKAMRDTVPEDGLMSGGQGEEMFRSMLDQHVAELTPSQWQGPNSLGETIVRQLSRALPASQKTPPTTPPAVVPET